MLMTPAIVRLVARRRFAALERRHGGSFWSSVARSALSTLIAALALVVSIPLWLVPPLVLVLPPLIWGWLTYRVLAFDVLAAHASRDERIRLLADERWALLAMGVACGYLGAVPSLIWAMSALTLVFAPFLILVSIWLYTLVFAFSSLWFAHYLLARAAGPARHFYRRAAAHHCRSSTHEHRPCHRRRRDPLRQARRQAPAQGHRAARRARPGACLGALRGRRPPRITADLKDAFASGDLVFCCGGIGATPDDHTRQSAAAALGRPLALHPEARDLVLERMRDQAREHGVAFEPERDDNRHRLNMAVFPEGAEIIPNPYNKIAGFAVRRARAGCSSCPAFR